jgi:dTDP-D-glucose 4,6-dehydratase|tara:strand:- start:702 stop:803 length:102 start_codon:yes stop_codon:yes gene_type:complete
LGWKAETSFEDGLEETIKWYKKTTQNDGENHSG